MRGWFVLIAILIFFARFSLAEDQHDDPVLDGGYVRCFTSVATQVAHLRPYLQTALIKCQGVHHISFDRETGYLTYWVTRSSEDLYKDFFFISKVLDFDWAYYLYGDLYEASFSFPSVSAVTVYTYPDEGFATFLPAKSDMLFLAEKNRLARDFYRKGLDYNSVGLTCMEGVTPSNDCFISNEAIRAINPSGHH